MAESGGGSNSAASSPISKQLDWLGQPFQPPEPVTLDTQRTRADRLQGICGEQDLAAQGGAHYPGGDGQRYPVDLERRSAARALAFGVLAQGDLAGVEADPRLESRVQAAQHAVVGDAERDRVARDSVQDQEPVAAGDLASAPLAHEVGARRRRGLAKAAP